MAQIFFERVTHGHDVRGAPMLATKIGKIFIPDFDFLHLEKWEVNEKYGWKYVAIALFVKKYAVRSGKYILDTSTKDVKEAPPSQF